jgi:hypothetical protein
MTAPVVIYTNLFTLEGRDEKKNKYIDMYYVWLLYIIKYGQLTTSDYCITLIDSVTFAHIKTSPLFNMLSNRIPKFKVVEYNQPKTIKDGILQRYYINDIVDSINPLSYFIHLDIDVLVINNIRYMFRNELNDNNTAIYLRPEDHILTSNYYGELATDEDKALIMNKCPNMPGFSAGIFAWKNSKDIRDFFELILAKAKETDKELYTVEQPFFNAAIFNYFFKKIGVFRFNILSPNIVGHNIFSTQANSETVLLNFCGIPGDDEFHWNKILTQLILTVL